jgi:hypothetical protein
MKRLYTIKDLQNEKIALCKIGDATNSRFATLKKYTEVTEISD